MPANLLKSQEMFLVSNNNTTVNGDAGSGIEVVIIDQGVTGVVLDVNVERVALSGNTSDYKFQNQSNSLVIYSGSSTVVTVPIQPDANGTQVTFNNGTVNVFTGQSGMTLGGVSVVAGSGSSSATQLTPLSINHWLNTAGSIPPTPPPVGPVIGTMGIGIVSMSTPIVAGVELKPAVIALGDNDVYMPIIFDWYDSDPSATPAPTAIIAGVSGNNTGYIVNASDANKNLWVKAYYTNTQGVASIVYSPVFNVGSLVGNSDTTPPTFVSAAVSPDGLSLIVTYDEPLSSTTAATTDFVVNVDSSPVTISSVAASGSAVTLTLAVAIQTSQVVEFSYTQPAGTDAIQDLAGNKAISLPITSVPLTPVTNHPPTGKPVIIGTPIIGSSLTIDESDIDDIDGLGTFEYVWNISGPYSDQGIPKSVISVSSTATIPAMFIAYDYYNGTTVTTEYPTVGCSLSVNILYTDGLGKREAVFSFPFFGPIVDVTVANDTPPTGAPVISGTTALGSVISSEVSSIADADDLGTFTYEWHFKDQSKPNDTQLARASGTSLTIPATYRKVNIYGSFEDASTIGLSVFLVIRYTDGKGKREVLTSNELGPITATANDTTPPQLLSALVLGAGTRVLLVFNEALSSTTAPATAFEVTVGGVIRAVDTVSVVYADNTVDLTLSSPVYTGQTVTVSYTDPTAGNDANAVQDLTGNDAVTEVYQVSNLSDVPEPT